MCVDCTLMKKKDKEARRKLTNAMAWVTDVETLIGNLSLRLKKLEDAPGTKKNENWGTTVEKFKELEASIRGVLSKIEWLNQHQNQCDQDVKSLWDRVAERDRKTEGLLRRIAKLEERQKLYGDTRVEKVSGRPLVEVLAKEKKA